MTGLEDRSARQLMSPLRTSTDGAAEALDRLLAALPGRTRRVRVRRLALTGAVAAVIVGVVVSALTVPNQQGGRKPVLTVTAPPPPKPRQVRVELDDSLDSPIGLIDLDGALWVDSYTDNKLVRIDIATGKSRVIGTTAGVLATDGDRVYVLDLQTGNTDIRSSTGTLQRSVNLGSTNGREAENIAADGRESAAGLWTATCCDGTEPIQHLQERDLDTLTARDLPLPVNIKAEGDSGSQLSAGASGVWFLNPDGTFLYQVAGSPDGHPTKTFDVHKRLGYSTIAGDTLVAAQGRVVFETDEGVLTTIDPFTLKMHQSAEGEPDGTTPTGTVVVGTTAYVSFPDRVIGYNLFTLKPIRTLKIHGVSAMTSGPDGVWAAAGPTLVQLAP